MQGEIFKNWRILSATLFSVVLIAGAYLLARGAGTPQVAQASTETALLQAIATQDSDSDGLPDWEEALYGTDPHNPDTFHLGMTDGEAVAKGLIVPKAIADIPVAAAAPAASTTIDYAAAGLTPPVAGTLTDAFAKSFFTLYLSAKAANGGADLSSSQTSALATQAMDQLSQSIAPTADYRQAADMTVSGSGPDALRAFAAAAEAVLKRNATDATMSEIGYFQAAVQEGDTSALAHLTALAKSYRDSAVGIAALPVPQELAADDLSIVNAIMRLSEIDSDFARVNSDPLTAMLALEQYPQTELTAERAFTALADTYAASGVVLKNGTPGAAFVNLMADLGAQQRAAAAKP
ncbi:MAG TPA: thrombospondin type 3 repeat-containing protein [Candidatus Paceibacterota bacterium]|nr:thrombospondin type 3 repeat-containing protein [Candidatus Paceibacterota bacterium]